MWKWSLMLLAPVTFGCTSEPSWEGKTAAAWRKELHSQDATGRARAATAFTLLIPPQTQAIPDLMRLLNDPDEHVCQEACLALGFMGPPAKKAVPLLLEAYKSKHRGVRMMAGVALQKIDPQEAAKAGVVIDDSDHGHAHEHG